MKKNHLKLMMAVNFVLMLLYIGLLYSGAYDFVSFTFGMLGFLGIGIAGSIVNIIALLVMWVRGTKLKKVIITFSIIIAICVFCIVLCFVLGTLLLLLPLSVMWVFLYSMIFQVYMLCLDRKDYSYIAYILLPVLAICILMMSFWS